jgi:hypothetical protein
MIPERDGADGVRLRSVRQVLTAAEVGLRWGDNVGPEITMRYLASRAPIDVATSLRERPRAVLVLEAVNRSDGVSESGCRVVWSWRGSAIRIESIDVSDTSDEYDVTLGVLKGSGK